MKRYQLIKEYPGSQKKGTIFYWPHKVRVFKEDFKMKNPDRYTNYCIFETEEYLTQHKGYFKLL